MKSTSLILGLTFVLSGCRTTGIVGDPHVAPDAPQGVGVPYGTSRGVKVGDRIVFHTDACKSIPAGRHSMQKCTEKIIGEGEIVRVLGESESIAQPDPGVVVEPKMHFELKPK